jgi:large subunit ribosomal protein L21
MFAVIKTGGKQYRVAASDLIEVEKLPGAAGDPIAFGEVLMIGGEAGVSVGGPLVAGASVAGEIVGQERAQKVIAFKKRRRQNSKRTRGHRQHLTLVRITEILTDGKAPTAKAAADAGVPAEEPMHAAEPKAPAAEAAADGEAAKPARKPRAKPAPKAADKA